MHIKFYIPQVQYESQNNTEPKGSYVYSFW